MELLIGIAVAGILAAIAVLGSGFLDKYRLNAASRDLLADLQWVRQQAITRRTANNSHGFGVRFDSPSRYTLFEFDDDDTGSREFYKYESTEEEKSPRVRDLPRNCQVTKGASADPSGDVLLYDRHGMARNENWGPGGDSYVLRLKEVTPPRCVVISSARIREGVWNETDSKCEAR